MGYPAACPDDAHLYDGLWPFRGHTFRWGALLDFHFYGTASLELLFSSNQPQRSQSGKRFEPCEEGLFSTLDHPDRRGCLAARRFALFLPGAACDDGVVSHAAPCKHAHLAIVSSAGNCGV